ncbi:hypothetical protein [Streptomyces erythrochromogenes]|nr:hypothetical protein OG364_17695 [Streptomyces erythrochromogenes]
MGSTGDFPSLVDAARRKKLNAAPATAVGDPGAQVRAYPARA